MLKVKIVPAGEYATLTTDSPHLNTKNPTCFSTTSRFLTLVLNVLYVLYDRLPGTIKLCIPACRSQNLVKHFTKTQKLLQRLTKPPVTIDGLPTFVPASHWTIDPHTPWVSIACTYLHACRLVLTIATPM